MSVGNQVLKISILATTVRAIRDVRALSREIDALNREFNLSTDYNKSRGIPSSTVHRKERPEGEEGRSIAGDLTLLAAASLLLKKTIVAAFTTGSLSFAKSIPTHIELDTRDLRESVAKSGQNLSKVVTDLAKTKVKLEAPPDLTAGFFRFDDSISRFVDATGTPLDVNDSALIDALAQDLQVDSQELKVVLSRPLTISEAARLQSEGFPVKFGQDQIAVLESARLSVDRTPIPLDVPEIRFNTAELMGGFLHFEESTGRFITALGQPIDINDEALIAALAKEMRVDPGELKELLDRGVSLQDAERLMNQGFPVTFGLDQLQRLENTRLSVDPGDPLRVEDKILQVHVDSTELYDSIDRLFDRKISLDLVDFEQVQSNLIRLQSTALEKNIKAISDFAESRGTLVSPIPQDESPSGLETTERLREVDDTISTIKSQLRALTDVLTEESTRMTRNLGSGLEETLRVGAAGLRASLVDLNESMKLGDKTSLIDAARHARTLSDALAETTKAFRDTQTGVQDFGDFLETLQNAEPANISREEVQLAKAEVSPDAPISTTESFLNNEAYEETVREAAERLDLLTKGATRAVQALDTLSDKIDVLDLEPPKPPDVPPPPPPTPNLDLPALESQVTSTQKDMSFEQQELDLTQGSKSVLQDIGEGFNALGRAIASPVTLPLKVLDPDQGVRDAISKISNPVQTVKEDLETLANAVSDVANSFSVNAEELAQRESERKQKVAETFTQNKQLESAPKDPVKKPDPVSVVEISDSTQIGSTEIQAAKNAFEALGSFYKKLQVEERKLLGKRADALREFRNKILDKVSNAAGDNPLANAARSGVSEGFRPFPEMNKEGTSSAFSNAEEEIRAAASAIVLLGSDIENQVKFAQSQAEGWEELAEVFGDFEELDPPEAPAKPRTLDLLPEIPEEGILAEVRKIHRMFQRERFEVIASYKLENADSIEKELLAEIIRFDRLKVALGIDIELEDITPNNIEDLALPESLKQSAYKIQVGTEAITNGSEIRPVPEGDFLGAVALRETKAVKAAVSELKEEFTSVSVAASKIAPEMRNALQAIKPLETKAELLTVFNLDFSGAQAEMNTFMAVVDDVQSAMNNVGADKLDDDFAAGIAKQAAEIDRVAHEVGLSGGESLVEGFKEGTDSHSPSRKAIAEMRNFANGIKVGDEKYLADIGNLSEKRGEEFSKAFQEGLDDGSIETVIQEVKSRLEDGLYDLTRLDYSTASLEDIQSKLLEVISTFEGALTGMESVDLAVDIDDVKLQEAAEDIQVSLQLISALAKDVSLSPELKGQLESASKSADATLLALRAIREERSKSEAVLGIDPAEERKAVRNRDHGLVRDFGTPEAFNTGIKGFNRITREAEKQGRDAGAIFADAFDRSGLGNLFDQTASQLGASFGGVFQGLSGEIGGIISKLVSSRLAAAAFTVGLTAGIVGISLAILPLALRVEQLSARFKSVGLNAGTELRKVQDLAKDLRVNFESLAELKINVEAATVASDLNINSDKLVKEFANVARGFNLDPDRQKRVEVGLTQGISKGAASQEEIRQQIGEALPGFVNAIAKALDLSVADANRKIATGTVSSQVFVEAIGILNDQVAATGGVDAAKSTLDAEIQLLKTQLTLLALEFSALPLAGAKLFLQGLNKMVEVVQSSSSILKALLGGVFVASITSAIGSLFNFSKGLAFSTKGLRLLVHTKKAAAGIGGLVSAFGAVPLALGALVTAFSVGKELLSENLSDTAKGLREFTKKIREENNPQPPTDSKSKEASESNIFEKGERTGSSLKDTADTVITGVNRLQNFLLSSAGLGDTFLNARVPTFSRAGEKNNIKEKSEFSSETSKRTSQFRGLDRSEIVAVGQQMEDLLAKKEGLETEIAIKLNLGESDASVAGLREQVASLDSRMEELSKKSFGFDSVSELEEFLRRVQDEIDKLEEESLDKNPEEKKATQEIINLKKQELSDARQLLKVYEQQFNAQKTQLALERSLASQSDREIVLDIKDANAQIKLNDLLSTFQLIPEEANVEVAVQGVENAQGRLESLKETAKDLESAFAEDTNSRTFLNQLGAGSLGEVSADDLAVFENSAARADESVQAAFARFKPLLEIAKQYRNTQKDIVGATVAFSDATLKGVEANRDLLNSLRAVRDEVEAITAFFDARKLALDISFTNQRTELLSGRGDKESLDKSQESLSQEQRRSELELLEERRDSLAGVVDLLNEEQRERAKALLRGKNLTAATQEEVQLALLQIARLRDQGRPVDGDVENALSAQSTANNLDLDIASIRESIAQADRDIYDRDQEAAKNRAKEVADAIRSISDTFSDLLRSMRDLVLSLKEEVRNIKQEIGKITQDIAGKSLISEFKSTFGKDFVGSFLQKVSDDLIKGAGDIANAFSAQENVEAKAKADLLRIEDQVLDAQKNRAKALESVIQTQEDLVKKFAEDNKIVSVGKVSGNRDQLYEEYNKLADKDGELNAAETKRAGELYLTLTGSLEGLEESAKKLKVTFAEEGSLKDKINNQLTEEGKKRIELAEKDLALAIKFEEEAIKSAEAAKVATRELVAVSDNLKRVTIQQTLVDLKSSLEETVESFRDAGEKLKTEIDRFGLDRSAFARGDRELTPNEKFEVDKVESGIQFRELEQRFKDITSTLTKSKSGELTLDEGSESREKLFNFIDQTIPAKEAGIFKESVIEASGDLQKLIPVIDILIARFEGLAPAISDLQANLASKDLTRRRGNAQDDVNLAEQRLNIEQTSRNRPVTGSFQETGRQNILAEIEMLKATAEQRELLAVSLARSSEEAEILRENFLALDAVTLSNLRAESEYLGNALKEALSSGLTTLFTDLINGTKSAGEAFADFASNLIAQIGAIAAEIIAQQIILSLFGAGGQDPSGQRGGGLLGSIIGLFGGGFREGGEVGSGAGGSDLLSALKAEGSNARVVVAHTGERMLSAKTGDAQAFSQLEKSGAWDEIRKGTFYSQGGVVGGIGQSASRSVSSTRNTTHSQSNANVNLNVYGASDYDSFKKSSSQVHAELGRMIRQADRRRP